jgi:preprotein translocase subunit SecA
LHQAIEAKENVEIQKESRTFASVTFQNYFRIYKKLSGMTGTALTSAEEFYKVYGLNVLPVPTHRGVLRKDHNDLIYKTESAKFRAVASEVKERNKKGQPVLIGTASITKNELLSEYLKAEGIPHEVLNAKNHTREGEIIAQAGKKGAVTIATNLAGRGVDIKLGGNPAKDEDYEEVKSLGGLFVLGTERHDARRIDNQLRGRSGRQGDPGETQFFVSLDDHLIRVFGGENLKSLMGRVGMTEDMPIESGILTRLIENAQEKIEGFNFDARKHVLEFDDVLNFQRKIMYARRREILVGDSESVVKYIREIDAKYPVENNLELENENSDDSKSKFNIEEIASKLSTDTGYLESVRRVILQTIDMLWIEHLEVMDYMRSSVNLRAYGQRDPLVEYKREGLRLFKEMEMAIEAEVLKLLPQIQSNTVFLNNSPVSNQKLVETREGAEELTKEKQVSSDTKVLRNSDGEKVGRNDPCPCGSGKKYKNCGLVNSEEHERNMQNK